ncbi:MAG: hypothetical protein CM1200mP41_24690 [Gammaproteobacteria bacterium]|nr:MAG: hypothetical protein CM1200mP41_24690 [Gammaproteobacteria bacterium]
MRPWIILNRVVGSPNTLGSHMEFISTARNRTVGPAGTAIAHCPHSNMALASGLCRVSDLEQAGSPVGLGVDGSASNDASNAIEEVRQAMLLQRTRTGRPAALALRTLCVGERWEGPLSWAR